MATITLCLGRPTQQLPCPIEPNKISRDQDTRPANGRFALGRADLPPSRPCSPAKQHWPTPPNLHSLDSWSAVSCNEGFCNASERQRLPSATDMASQKPHRSANPSTRYSWRPSLGSNQDMRRCPVPCVAIPPPGRNSSYQRVPFKAFTKLPNGYPGRAWSA